MAETDGFPCLIRLSWSAVFGQASFVDQEGRHNHVLRLRIHRSLFSTAVGWVTGFLPLLLRERLRRLIPGPFLPPTVIIKKLKPTWDAEFEDEKRIYQKLAPLQGRSIPTLYGEGVCDDGARALLLSDVGDTSLYAERVKHLSKSALKGMLQPAVKAMLDLGVEPADQNPRNYHLLGDDVYVLDFEDTGEVDPAKVDKIADAVADGVAHWAVFYHQHNDG